MLRALRIAWLGSLCAFLALLALYYARRVDPRDAALYARDVRRLQALHAQLDTDVLSMRSELLLHYDSPNATIDELFRLHRGLALAPSFLSSEARADLAARVASSQQLLEEVELRFEQFKQDNAQLRNSMRYVPTAAKKILDRPEASDAAAGDRLAAAVKDLLRDVLLYELFPEASYRKRVETAAAAAKSAMRGEAGDERNDQEALLRHVATILKKKPLVETSTERMVDPLAIHRAEELEAAWTHHHEIALDRAQMRRSWLFVLAVASLMCAAAEIIVRQRRAESTLRFLARKLKRANKQLRRERAREKELADLKSRFVSMTSHEYRTPLSVIKSSAELLERYGEGWDAERRGKHLARIRLSVGEMTKLLEGVLMLGKVDAGTLACEPKPLALEPLCSEVVGAVRESFIAPPPIHCRLEGEPMAPLDERILRHVLTNLLSNAVKYGADGGDIALEVACGAGEVVFAIRDHGIGIPEADRPHLFDSFHRGSNVGDIPGTGLGLALVKRLVERHHGHIQVESVEGEGTTFVVTVPVAAEAST